MKLILRSNVNKLGNVGDLIKVKDGYARNYLLPKNLAVIATAKSIKMIESEKLARIRKEAKIIKAKQEFAKKLSAKSFTITMKSGENDKLYGAVTVADIEKVINKEGFEIDRKKILLDEPINQLGVYTIKIKIYHDVDAEIKLWIVKE
jgi:large subunit ribosomal protein L9